MSKINWLKELGWDEENLEDLRMAGFAYLRQGKYDIAIPFFEALTILDKESAYDIQTLGALYLETNQAEKAIEYLSKSLALESDHAPTLLNMAKALILLGKKDEALKLAHLLEKETNLSISNVAKALILAYE